MQQMEKKEKVDGAEYKAETKNCRKFIRETKGHKKKSVTSRVMDNKKDFFQVY